MSKPQSTSDPVLEEYNSRVFSAVLKTTQAASALAAKDLHYIKTTTPDATTKIDLLAERLLGIANSLLTAVGAKDGVQNVEQLAERWDKVSDVNDKLFEKTDTYLDLFVSNKTDLKPTLDVTATVPAQTITKKRKRFPQPLVNLERPQLKFDSKPDNYDTTPFTPLLTSKPHAMETLEESLKRSYPNKDGMEVYQNPYTYEIEHSKYPKSMKKPSKPIEAMPLETTSAIWVDTPALLRSMLRDLKNEREIAVDLEHHDTFSYRGFVCLMQISTRSQDYVIDTLVLRKELEVLNVAFTDPKIIKVFHGAASDVIWLQRDFGLYIVNMFDTYHAARVLNLEGKSLQFLLDRYCSFQASKEYQLADWRVRPLTKPMLEYARCDTHFLLVLYDKLRNQLLANGEENLEAVLANSRKESMRTYEREVYDPQSGSGPSGWQGLAKRWALSDDLLPLLKELCHWREEKSKAADVGVNYALSNNTVFSLLKAKPIDVPGVMHAIGRNVSTVVQDNAEELAEIIADFDQGITAKRHQSQRRPSKVQALKTGGIADKLREGRQEEDETLTIRRAALADELFDSPINQLTVTKQSTFWGGILDATS
ncbi:ribonuclease H-like domain-containing protein [Lipomyces arxii]|uniref:ribonuclease H-like domain-containing protein n=1 Tax=Lipomyces arxii TaxID=56418 RepID=UPI0034CF537D